MPRCAVQVEQHEEVTDRPADALLLETFGPELLAYLCNVDLAQIERRIRDAVALPAPAEVALNQLIPWAERVARERLDSPGLPFSFALGFLGNVPDGAETSIGNLVRLSAGGHIPTPDADLVTDDTVKALLFRLARDAYPQLLIPAEDPWHHAHLSFFRHPATSQLQQAVHADELLGAMYPSEDDGLGRRGAIFNSLGRGGSVQSVMFGETVVGAGWDLATMSFSPPSLSDLYRSVSTCVDVLRSAAAGESTETRALLAFTGITTGDRPVETPWGTLRPITEVERTAAPPALDGSVSGTDSEGRVVTVHHAGEIVLETALPFTLTAHEWNTENDFPEMPPQDRMEGATALRRRIEGIQLAVLLAADRPPGQLASARFAWQWIADPTAYGRSLGWATPAAAPGFMPTELTAEECAALENWCGAIDAHWSPAVDIAVRRVISAAQVRSDPSDRLVDSVIAWENLFGTSEGEPRLRISSAMAWLLASSAADRVQLQREIKQLYDDRSKIVHGGSFDGSAMAVKANRALDLAISSLRELFGCRVDILSLPDGSARSLQLLLDIRPMPTSGGV